MSKSRLSRKFSICELIAQLDDNECINVIRSCYQELELSYGSLNACLTKIIISCCKNISTKSLEKIQTTIEESIANDNSSSRKEKCKKKDFETSKILKLPIDLICNTSLYLNETDIFNFEQCCILFYQIINNSCYLNQSNTFKTFILTQERLNQMTQTKYSFYKYSKATTFQVLNFDDTGTEDQLKLFIPEFENTWQLALSVSRYDNWLSSMFKSIKIMKLGADGTLLFYIFPVDILFDSNESQLEKIRLSHWWCGRCGGDYISYLCNKFETKYINLKNKFNRQDKKIKVLKCLIQYNHNHEKKPCICILKHIESKHIVLRAANSDLFVWDCDANLNLRMISFEYQCDAANQNQNVANANNNGNIDTLRFIDIYRNISTNIYNNGNVIESLNFHNSVKNMTISVRIPSTHKNNNDWAWSKTMSNLLVKKDFYHLTNVNMLWEIVVPSIEMTADKVDWVFQVLNNHEKLLKHQFGQLNIGLKIVHNCICQKCYVLEWNSKIDNKVLKSLQVKCNHSRQSKNERNTNIQRYHELKQQWL